jgi:ATP-binding cassette subfamily B protein
MTMLNSWPRVLRLIWRTSPGGVLGIFISTALEAVIPVAQVVLLGMTVNAVQAAPDLSSLLIFPLLFGGLALFSLLLTTLQGYWQTSLEQRVSNAFNLQLMEKSGTLALQDFEDPEVYNRLQLATREATGRPYQFFTQLISAVSGAVSLVLLMGVLVTWSPLVALFVLLSPILPVVANQIFVRRLWEVERDRSEERRRGQYLLALVTNDKTYKETRLFGLVGYFTETYRSMLGRFYDIDMGIERRRSRAAAISGLVGVAVTGAAVYFAIADAFAMDDLGRLAAYIGAIGAVSVAAQMLIGGLGQLVEHTLFLGNLFGFLDLEPRSTKAVSDRDMPATPAHEITFEDVSFTYPGQTLPALEGFSATFGAGRTVALVGENGAGKSTIVKLLSRLYEPTAGRILVDGIDIAEFELSAYRDHLTVLFQDFIQYEASVRQNVAFGRIEKLEDEDGVREALHQAEMTSTVRALPEGIETQLGKWFADGKQLSGGQWQRIALARALFRRSPIIVLDEPTASLDARAEEAVFAQLTEESHAATKILISHRFSTVRMADDVLVLQDGHLVEKGDHDSLMTYDGLYAQMFRLQARGYVE